MRSCRRAVWPLGLLALAVAMGCTSVVAPNPLQVTTSADPAVTSPAEPAVVRVTVTNLGDERVTWGRGSSTCQLHLLVRVGGVDLPASYTRICSLDLDELSLKPGASRTEGIRWAGHVQGKNSGDPPRLLMPGLYKVRGAAGRTAGEPVLVRVLAES